MQFLRGHGERTGRRKKPGSMKKFLFLVLLFLGFSCKVESQTVYVTKTGEKYHTDSCRYLKYSKIEIELDDAKNLGYEACLVCKPGDNNTNTRTTETPATSTSVTPPKNTTASQCTGTTKAGNRCKRRTTNSNGRCYQH